MWLEDLELINGIASVVRRSLVGVGGAARLAEVTGNEWFGDMELGAVGRGRVASVGTSTGMGDVGDIG